MDVYIWVICFSSRGRGTCARHMVGPRVKYKGVMSSGENEMALFWNCFSSTLERSGVGGDKGRFRARKAAAAVGGGRTAGDVDSRRSVTVPNKIGASNS